MLGSAGGALAGSGSQRRSLPELARAACRSEEGPLPDEALRERLAGHLMEIRGLKALTRRVSEERRTDPAVPSMLKLLSTETFMRKQDLTIDLLGLDGLTWDGTDSAHPARDWLRSRANSIEGGTSEIQLNIIAKRALGLPEAVR
jgi:acyl-CoA dehydrogenase